MNPTNRSSGKSESTPFDVDRRLLVKMISRVNDPVVARVFLCTVEMYPDLKLQFLGAYLTAEEAVKRSQIRYAKARDMGLAAARSKRAALKLMVGLWSLSQDVVRRVRNALEARRLRKARELAKQHASSAKVVLLPLPFKATGTDN